MSLTAEDALNQFGGIVYRVAHNFAKNDADAQDIYQEVFMRFMKYGIKKEYESLDHVKHWLIRVTINCYHTFITKEKRREELEHASHQVIDEHEKDHSALIEAVQYLDEKYRIVIHLYYYEDYKVREIAAILKESENTVKTRLTRARRLVKEQLKGGGAR